MSQILIFAAIQTVNSGAAHQCRNVHFADIERYVLRLANVVAIDVCYRMRIGRELLSKSFSVSDPERSFCWLSGGIVILSSCGAQSPPKHYFCIAPRAVHAWPIAATNTSPTMHTKQEAKDFVSANIAAWDEVAPIHRQHNHARHLQEVRQADFCCLDEIELRRLQALDVVDKSVAQLCCNNGRELISVKKMGAARCVGFDAAAGFISDAKELAEAAHCDVTFVSCDIHDISEEFTGNFDIVTITIGVISWMPDLAEFFDAAARLLRPGGAFFIYEHHPILEMIKPGPAGAALEWEVSYFSSEPYVSTEGLDYYGGTDYGAKPATSFMHTMSSIVMAGLGAGFSVEHFEEFPHHISNAWWNVEHAQIGLPMCYTLVFRKSAQS